MSERLKRLQERHDHYHNEGRLFDVERRSRKADKILAVLDDYSRVPLSNLLCLDVGCSAGIMTKRFAEHFKAVVGLDVDREAVAYAQETQKNKNVQYLLGDGAHIPLPANSIDVAICAQVYEHVPDPVGLAHDVHRVLKPGGCCFFSGPNRLAIMEEHTGLPFIHWLPRGLANQVVRILGRGERFEENLKSYWALRALWHQFAIVDYSPALIADPVRFSLQTGGRFQTWAARVPAGFYRRLAFVIPNPNWILLKGEH